MSRSSADTPLLTRVAWRQTFRIIRSRFPPIDLFEDIADPADWDALARAEARSNPRLIESIGRLDLVPVERRVGGPGASYVMAPFTHCSSDRPSRFSDGTFGVYYAGDRFEVALAETMHHHAHFMAVTQQAPGWTSEFRELVGTIDADLHDIRGDAAFTDCLDLNDYREAQRLGARLRAGGSDGVVYPSVREPGGECIGVFYPDVVSIPVQGRHLAYHWDGVRVDQIKDLSSRVVYAVS